jgi:hypothetical protein
MYRSKCQKRPEKAGVRGGNKKKIFLQRALANLAKAPQAQQLFHFPGAPCYPFFT